MTVSQTSLGYDILDSFDEYRLGVHRISPNWDLFGVFLWLGCGYSLGEEDPRGEVPFPSHYIRGSYCPHDSSLSALLTWLR